MRQDFVCENYLTVLQLVPTDIDWNGTRHYDDLYDFLELFLDIEPLQNLGPQTFVMSRNIRTVNSQLIVMPQDMTSSDSRKQAWGSDVIQGGYINARFNYSHNSITFCFKSNRTPPKQLIHAASTTFPMLSFRLNHSQKRDNVCGFYHVVNGEVLFEFSGMHATTLKCKPVFQINGIWQYPSGRRVKNKHLDHIYYEPCFRNEDFSPVCDLIGPLPEDTVCCICLEHPSEPQEARCKHVFCLDCIDTWEDYQHTCPCCRKPLR